MLLTCNSANCSRKEMDHVDQFCSFARLLYFDHCRCPIGLAVTKRPLELAYRDNLIKRQRKGRQRYNARSPFLFNMLKIPPGLDIPAGVYRFFYRSVFYCNVSARDKRTFSHDRAEQLKVNCSTYDNRHNQIVEVLETLASIQGHAQSDTSLRH